MRFFAIGINWNQEIGQIDNNLYTRALPKTTINNIEFDGVTTQGSFFFYYYYLIVKISSESVNLQPNSTIFVLFFFVRVCVCVIIESILHTLRWSSVCPTAITIKRRKKEKKNSFLKRVKLIHKNNTNVGQKFSDASEASTNWHAHADRDGTKTISCAARWTWLFGRNANTERCCNGCFLRCTKHIRNTWKGTQYTQFVVV